MVKQWQVHLVPKLNPVLERDRSKLEKEIYAKYSYELLLNLDPSTVAFRALVKQDLIFLYEWRKGVV